MCFLPFVQQIVHSVVDSIISILWTGLVHQHEVRIKAYFCLQYDNHQQVILNSKQIKSLTPLYLNQINIRWKYNIKRIGHKRSPCETPSSHIQSKSCTTLIHFTAPSTWFNLRVARIKILSFKLCSFKSYVNGWSMLWNVFVKTS